MTEVRIIEWVDSSLQNAQVHASDAPLPEVITSVGFVVREDSDGILLARDDHKDDEWRGLLAIPRCAILAERTPQPLGVCTSTSPGGDLHCALAYGHAGPHSAGDPAVAGTLVWQTTVESSVWRALGEISANDMNCVKP